MRRRDFITLLGGATAWPLAARAQQAPRVPIVGFLHPGFSDSGSPVFDALGQGLRDAGYVEGETIKIEARWAQGKPEALPQLTRELIQLHTDVLVATARPSIEAARAATIDLPIVANDLESDPVASGYVASLAHPGQSHWSLSRCSEPVRQMAATNKRHYPHSEKNRRSLGRNDGHLSA